MIQIDDLQAEEEFHDHDQMAAMSVIENEINLMQEMLKSTKAQELLEIYQTKFDALEFAKSV